MKNDIIYTCSGALTTMERIKERKYTRCNGWHKIYLKNIKISKVNPNDNESLLYELFANTNGKKCTCGFHCLPLEMYQSEILHQDVAN